ncbi:MAG: TetR/AcrR family transcriptional regulator [Deltaproteobacteria bacterium]|nr:TetR/AcrR family transcriptional regulator [Deltaproteobacteria bacterium]
MEASSTLEQPSSAQPSSAQRGATRNKVETQAKIVAAAMEFFFAGGYERTSVASIAAQAGVSPATVFWHFGDKASLFQEACKRFMVPFVEQMSHSCEVHDGPGRLIALIDTYERFVTDHRGSIETFVRWFLESPALRAGLQDQLLTLNDAFGRDVHKTLEVIVGNEVRARTLAEGLLSTMHGNLLLAFIDPDPAGLERRRAGLRAMAQLVVAAPRGD